MKMSIPVRLPRAVRASLRRPTAPVLLSENPGPVSVVAGVLAGIMLILAVVLGLMARDEGSTRSASDEALARAKSSIATLLSYDFRSIDSAVSKNRDLVTGTFAEEYEELVDTKLVPTVRQRKLANTTEVADAAVISASDDVVRVLLYLNQSYGTVGQTDLNMSGSRVRVTMKKVEGTWRVDKLSPV